MKAKSTSSSASESGFRRSSDSDELCLLIGGCIERDGRMNVEEWREDHLRLRSLEVEKGGALRNAGLRSSAVSGDEW